MEPRADEPPREVRPGIGAVVLDHSGRVLLHHRRATGEWAPPSGTVEPGESLTRALHREILEEASLHIRIRPILLAVRLAPGRVSIGTALHAEMELGRLANPVEVLDAGAGAFWAEGRRVGGGHANDTAI